MSPVRKILWPGRDPHCGSCGAAVEINPWISVLYSLVPILVIMYLFKTLEYPLVLAVGILALVMVGQYFLPFREKKSQLRR